MLLSVHVTSVLFLVWFWTDYGLILELHTLTLAAQPSLCALGSYTCKHTASLSCLWHTKTKGETWNILLLWWHQCLHRKTQRGGVASNRMNNSLSKYKDFLLQLKTLVSYYSNKSTPDTIDTVDVSWNLGSHADSPPHKKNSQAHKIKFSGISLRWPRAPHPLAACMYMVTTL